MAFDPLNMSDRELAEIRKKANRDKAARADKVRAQKAKADATPKKPPANTVKQNGVRAAVAVKEQGVLRK